MTYLYPVFTTNGCSFMAKSVTLKNIPPDVYEKILEIQSREKIKCSCQKSIETIIYNLIRKAPVEKQ